MAKFFRLPAHLSDLPPPTAGRLECARRAVLDWLEVHDYRLCLPSLAEYVETLGANDESLLLDIVKMTDTLSGRTMGIRADHTPQIARFDATLGGNEPRRICYCGPALRTRPPQPWKQREIMQIGAEIFNLPPPTADWEIIRIAAGALSAAGIDDIAIDIGHVGIVRKLLGEGLDAVDYASLCRHWARCDFAVLREKTPAAEALIALSEAGEDMNDIQNVISSAGVEAKDMLNELSQVLDMLRAEKLDVKINFNEIGGYGYHTGVAFCIYGRDFVAARGGRYAREGFRPAAGFSMDLREIVENLPPLEQTSPVVSCPVHHEKPWFDAVEELRRQKRRLCFVSADENPPAPALYKTDDGKWKVRES